MSEKSIFLSERRLLITNSLQINHHVAKNTHQYIVYNHTFDYKPHINDDYSNSDL